LPGSFEDRGVQDAVPWLCRAVSFDQLPTAGAAAEQAGRLEPEVVADLDERPAQAGDRSGGVDEELPVLPASDRTRGGPSRDARSAVPAAAGDTRALGSPEKRHVGKGLPFTSDATVYPIALGSGGTQILGSDSIVASERS